MGITNYEEVGGYPLDPEVRVQMLQSQNECTFIWGTQDHWAVGVTMSYVWRDGRFWLTSSGQRKRISAVRRDPRVSIVVSGVGTEVGPARTVTVKGRCIIHDDKQTKSWAYPAIADAIMGGPGDLTDHFIAMLDSERRLVLEVVPEKWITFDAAKMMADSLESWMAGERGELLD
ncbi:MAG: hypothetical protein GY812_03970 [Actinomycetia bacterium]|nr:hypothetical protein [Actinomycetes bacterium]